MTFTTSFRDPAGFVIQQEKKIFRCIHLHSVETVQRLLISKKIATLIAEGSIVKTTTLSKPQKEIFFDSIVKMTHHDPKNIALVVEHERIPFPSYPYEWPPEMLCAAGALTLKLAETLSIENFGLKDATPYNVLFRGPSPVFIDFLSFEERHPCDPVWLPYAQFMRTFILPLLANKNFKLSLSSIFLARRDGLECEDLYEMCRGIDLFKPAFFSYVTLPSLFSKWMNKNKQSTFSIYEPKKSSSPEHAAFVLQMSIKRLKKALRLASPDVKKNSHWSGYMTLEKSYDDEEFRIKHAIVDSVLKEHPSKHLLDIGCNNGHFSILSAKHGASVVAIDFDPSVVGRLWTQASAEQLDILPLVIDISRPSPGIGWKNTETKSFLERAKNAFDMVLMLAVIHHLHVTERIPLEEIAEMASSFTTERLIIEFVGPQDPMFRRISRGRDHLHKDLSPEVFEKAFETHFIIESKQRVSELYRWVYVMRKKGK